MAVEDLPRNYPNWLDSNEDRKARKPTASTFVYLRAPRTLDGVLEEMARRERRSKTAVLGLSREECAERRHGDLLQKYKEAAT